MTNLALLIIAAVLSALGTEGVRQWALRSNTLVDVPNHRSSHTQPTPRGGGLAIALVCVALGAFALPASWAPLGIAVLAIATVSFIDDHRPLPNRVRLATHLGAAALVIYGFGLPESLSLFGATVSLPAVISAPLCLLWIAGLINAYNFMDGIDGIAGVQGLVAGLGWMVFGYVNGTDDLIIGAILAGSCAGFLTRNWAPAAIFMGDVGSTSLGLVFGALALSPTGASASEPSMRPALALALVLPFVFDTAFTFLRRLRAKERVFEAHRTHIYQRLAPTKAQHRRIALLYGALATLGITLALPVSPAVSAIAFASPLVVLGITAWRLGPVSPQR